MIWILFIGTMALSLWAAARVKSVYHRYNQGVVRSGVTGREVAAQILRLNGIHDVEIQMGEGILGDHYDPIHKRLVLSPDNYHGRTPAALGVAAHEAGHAIQHKVGYSMMTVRQTLVPATQIASGASQLLIIVGIVLGAKALGGIFLMLGAVALAMICLFQLITLPVEFDATARAKAQLVNLGLVDRDEMPGVNETLDAAALTYVAAFIASLGSLLHILMLIMGGRSRD